MFLLFSLNQQRKRASSIFLYKPIVPYSFCYILVQLVVSRQDISLHTVTAMQCHANNIFVRNLNDTKNEVEPKEKTCLFHSSNLVIVLYIICRARRDNRLTRD
jgi:hypothetical protein